ncbi:MAG: hypothetical protein FJ264_15195 [Planctomycetes bacterium]|nr:hypothetical protein [Planctomycetota bacterium]
MTETISSFYESVIELKKKYLPNAEIKIFYKRSDKISFRILIKEEFFIDVYRNTQTGRVDFTLIRYGTRIFEYDNSNGWHYHPVENPDTHIRCKELTVQEMFQNTLQIIKKCINLMFRNFNLCRVGIAHPTLLKVAEGLINIFYLILQKYVIQCISHRTCL